MGHTLRVNWVILKTSIEERFTFRGDFAFATLVRFLPIVTQMFLWSAIYTNGVNGDRGLMNGYSYGDMVAYYLLVMVGRAFSSMPGLSSGIARDVRDGTIKKFLTQPVDMLDYLFWHRVAHKLVYYFVAAAPFAFVFYLCRDYFPTSISWICVCGFVVSLLLSFLVGFFLEALLGLVAFWYLEVSSLLFIYMMLNYFMSGHMIPLDWLNSDRLSGWFVFIARFLAMSGEWLPFKYLAYVPAAVMLGKYSEEALIRELLLEAAWALGLFLACRIAFARGVRRFSAFGG